MKAKVVLVVVASIAVVLDLVTRKKRNMSALFAFGRERGWDIFLIDVGSYPKAIRSRSTMTYAARYRTKDESVHEAVLDVGWLGGVTLLEEKKLPRKVVLALADSSIPMDCRHCGARIPAGADRCPYCKSWRAAFPQN